MEGRSQIRLYKYGIAVLLMVGCLALPKVVDAASTQAACGGLGYYYPYLDLCVTLTNTPETYDQAYVDCQQSGRQLVEFFDYHYYEFFRGIVQREVGGDGNYWIGLDDIDEEGSFEWKESTPVNFTDWIHNEPNDGKGDEDCVHLSASRGYHWNDRQCDNPTGITPIVTKN